LRDGHPQGADGFPARSTVVAGWRLARPRPSFHIPDPTPDSHVPVLRLPSRIYERLHPIGRDPESGYRPVEYASPA